MTKVKHPLPLKPLKDNLLLLPVAREEMSPGGIVVPESKVKDPYKKGIVIDKGPGMSTEMDNGNSQIPDEIEEGDIVLYHQAAGWDIKFDGVTYVVVSWRQCETMVNPEYVKAQKNG